MTRWLIQVAANNEHGHQGHIVVSVADENGVEADLRGEFEALRFYYGNWKRKLQFWKEPVIWEPVAGFSVKLKDVLAVTPLADI